MNHLYFFGGSHALIIFLCLLILTEDVVPGKPTNLVTRVVLGMVRVSWDPPKESHIVVRQYVLSYGKMTPDEDFKKLANTTTSFLLQNLRKYFLSAVYDHQVFTN